MGEVKICGYKVKLEREISGIRYWMQVYQHRIPRYEVFEYVGWCRTENLFFFKSRKNSVYTWKRVDQLEGRWFKPYLMDMEQIEEAISEYIETNRN